MLNTAKIYTYFDLQQILKYSYLHTYIQSACLLIIHKIWAMVQIFDYHIGFKNLFSDEG